MISTPHAERDPLYFHSEPTPVPIFQRDWEFSQLLRIYRMRAPMRVLEIGTYHGGTLYHWLRNAQKGAHIVTIDSYSTGVDNRAMFHDWRPAGVDFTIISGDSHDSRVIAMAADAGPYDWIVIDADHLAPSVQADWDHYRPMAASGAIIALHDIMPSDQDWIQVSPVWEAIQHAGYITQELVCDPAIPDWGGWGLVFL